MVLKRVENQLGTHDNEEYDGYLSDNGSDVEEDSFYSDSNNDISTAINEFSTKKRKTDMVETDDHGEDNEEEGTEEQSTPKKKKKKKNNFSTDMKPPTAEEMIRLRETENLFHSNLFRLQIEEMIKEVRPKKMERKQIKFWLEKLKEYVVNIDDSVNSQLTEDFLPENMEFPLPHLPSEELRPTTFQKPISVIVTGSYSMGCNLGPSLSVDVVVVMPKKCFLKEDYLNCRYHRRRAVYLIYLASALRKSDLIDPNKTKWCLDGSSTLCPRLVVSPVDKLNTVEVYISAVPQDNTFKLSRFTPGKNNIRESWLSAGQLEDCRIPTPMYNTSVMRDLVLTSNNSIHISALENKNNIKDGIMLLKVWLKQRQLDVGPGSFSGYLVSMLVIALLHSRRLNSLMSSYQIVRNVWLFLSQTDWTKEGFTMCFTKQEPNSPSMEDFHQHFDVVFVDSTGYCNLAANIHRLTYHRVKLEAEQAVQCLDNPDMNSFQALFMIPMPFLHQFDHVFRLKKKKKVVNDILSKKSSTETRINYFMEEDSLFTNVVMNLLEQGLGKRLEKLVYQLPTVRKWPVSEKLPKMNKFLHIGVKLNPETAFSVVEKGPSANDPEAAGFRALWGNRCELRRFRDGTVCEAVVWTDPSASIASRRLIVKQMVETLLCERLGMPKNTLTYIANQLECLVTEKAFIPDGFEIGTGEEASNCVVQAFDSLAKQLRELPALPLDVTSVQGVSAVFRGAEVFPPLACTGRPQAKTGLEDKVCWRLLNNFGKAPDFIAPIEGVLQLGLSHKWPNSPDAVRRIQCAFYLHIAKALREQCDLQTQAYSDYVDIFKDGFVFRIRVVYPRVVGLLKESKTADGKLFYRETPESLELEKFSIHLPKLSGALHGLQQQFTGFSVACRLAKRWLSAQLLDNSHMPDIVTELLMASLFLSPEPFQALVQPQPMFLRFLHLLAHNNWHLEPVIVNFNGDLKREELLEIESHFRSERASLPPLFIATQYDKMSLWTKDAPTLPVLVRIVSLANQALSVLETTFLSSALLEECKVAFRPPMELYDAVIRLKALQVPRVFHAIDYTTKTPFQLKIPKTRKKIPITGFDPAQFYLQELRGGYSDYALFFHDTYGGTLIGVLFKPYAFEKKDFKVSHVHGRKPMKEEKKIVLKTNFDAIIEDFYIVGAGLVKSIDLSEKFSQKLSNLS